MRPEPGVHLAVLRRRYLDAALAGDKAVEARLSRNRGAPYGRVRPGDTIYLKQSSGPVRAVATAGEVRTLDDLSPARVRAIRREHDHLIGADPDYWNAKSTARYATLIWLVGTRSLTALDTIPPVPPLHGSAWVCYPAHTTTRSA